MKRVMKIGIDARFYGLKHAGLGRYVKNLITELEKIDFENQYVVFLQDENYNDYIPQGKNFSKTILKHHPYSIKSQLFDFLELNKYHFDLVHFPHFSYPVLYSGKFVVTIHDLIKNEFYNKGSSTRNTFIYKLKHWGYDYVLKKALTKSQRIITPTHYVKKELIKNYVLAEGKITAIYEGAEDSFRIQNLGGRIQNEVLEKYRLQKEKYLLYVGNVYPYKNVQKLLEVFAHLKSNNKKYLQFDNLKLALVCSRSVFYDRLKEKIREMNLEDTVFMLGFVPDSELSILYQNALAYITATLAEGFGITGLEAMAASCPVICSNKTCLPEVYGEASLYFDPEKTAEITNQIIKIQNSKIRKKQVERGKKQVQRYSWAKMATDILKIYEEI